MKEKKVIGQKIRSIAWQIYLLVSNIKRLGDLPFKIYNLKFRRHILKETLTSLQKVWWILLEYDSIVIRWGSEFDFRLDV